MESGDLAVFLAVAEAGAIGRAAERLHIVQSAVTTRIRKLEDAIGVELFRRHARGVAMTPAGETLLPFARQVGRLLAEARQAVTDTDTPRGRLEIGAMETTAAFRLGMTLAGFATRFPQVELTLRTGTTAEMVAQVLRQELEAAFVCGPVVHAQLSVRPVFRERLVAVAAVGVSSLTAATASGQVRMLVLRRGCSYRQRLEDLLARRGVPVTQVLEYGTFDAILACVSAGMGLTLLPAALLEQWASRHVVSILTLPDRERDAETVLVRRSQSYVSSAMREFLDVLEEGGKAPHHLMAAE